MTGKLAKKTPLPLEPEGSLRGVLYVLERHGKNLTPDMVREMTVNVRAALNALKQDNPYVKRLVFVALALEESTEIRVHKHGRGKETEHVAVLDHDLFTIAIKRLHELRKEL